MVYLKYRVLKSLNPSIAWSALNIPNYPVGHQSLLVPRQQEVHTVDIIIKTKLLNRGKQRKTLYLREGRAIAKGAYPITRLHSHIRHVHHFMHYLPSKIGKFIRKQSYQSSAYICIALHNLHSYMNS